jgi:hypothetical protein
MSAKLCTTKACRSFLYEHQLAHNMNIVLEIKILHQVLKHATFMEFPCKKSKR